MTHHMPQYSFLKEGLGGSISCFEACLEKFNNMTKQCTVFKTPRPLACLAGLLNCKNIVGMHSARWCYHQALCVTLCGI